MFPIATQSAIPSPSARLRSVLKWLMLASLSAMLFFMPVALFNSGSAIASGKTGETGLFAELHTAKGRILVRLFYRRAPMTVMNFIGLAEGGMKWTNPRTGKPTTEPLYRNLVFHRTRDFMIQTGDPTGTGKGGSGHEFADEFHPELRHAKAGMVSMANRGPNTNSSQFFITREPAPWLDDRYTVFGEVVSGLDVVLRIEKGDRLDKIVIRRKGEEAKAFNAQRAHELAKARIEALRLAARKTLPEVSSPLDAARVPKSGQPLRSPGSFEFLVIGHTGIQGLERLGRVFYYDKEGAMKIARKLVRLARSKDADFSDLVRRYTDMRHNTRARNVSHSPLTPASLKQIFHLAPGQISDPVDLPDGVFIFKRLD